MRLLVIALYLAGVACLGYFAGKSFPRFKRILPPVIYMIWSLFSTSFPQNSISSILILVGIYLFAAFLGALRKEEETKLIDNLDWGILLLGVVAYCILDNLIPPPSI